MRPQDDDYPEHIEAAVQAIVTDGKRAGRRVLREIAYSPREHAPRPRMSPAVRGAIFQRDRFHCRYCNGKIIPSPVLELVGFMYPDIFPSHPRFKGGLTHPAFISRCPFVDHIDPGSSGGAWRDLDNLVTACNPCNAIKSDLTLEQLGWRVKPVVKSDWDGLTRFYPALWQRAGRPAVEYHVTWMRALGYEVPTVR